MNHYPSEYRRKRGKYRKDGHLKNCPGKNCGRLCGVGKIYQQLHRQQVRSWWLYEVILSSWSMSVVAVIISIVALTIG